MSHADAFMTVSLPTPEATARLGAALSACLATGDVIALVGELGAGKTTLARGLIEALTGERDAPSPTYTLVQTYQTAEFEIWHADLYRLERPSEAVNLGLEDAFVEAVCVIEWPERLGALLPSDGLTIRLTADGGGRTALLSAPGGGWLERLEGLTLDD